MYELGVSLSIGAVGFLLLAVLTLVPGKGVSRAASQRVAIGLFGVSVLIAIVGGGLLYV
jgi:hypothetical protein